MNTSPSTEERIWAVLAHLSALAFGMGLILPVIGWAEQRRKSKYAAFHSLQALGYQSLGFTVWILGYLLLILILVVLMLIVFAVARQKDEETALLVITGFNIFLLVFIFAALGVYFLFPIIAAVSCALGKDYRYPFMGKRLAVYLEYDLDNENWLTEDREVRWMAAMGHFSVIIQLWGLLAPLTAWIMQGKRSLFLKIQSVQAVILHVFVLFLSFLAGGVYLFGFIVFIITIGLGENTTMDSPSGMIGFGILMVSMLIALLIVLVIPLFHIMGQWAGYRVLKGDDYRYPLIGRLVDRVILSGAKNPYPDERDPLVAKSAPSE